jgi:ketosteroid isomerase-like protein
MRSSLLAFVVVASLVVTTSSCAEDTESRQVSSADPAAAAPAAPPVVAVTEDVEGKITLLERDWVRAIVNKDAAAVEQLLASDFVGTSPTAHTFSRSGAIDELKSGKYVVDSMDLDEISVNPYGDMAVAFTSQEEKSRYEGKDTSGHYHFTDVWVKRDGRWQVVASHGTRYAAGHKAP